MGVEFGCFIAESAEMLDDASVLRDQRGQHLVPDADAFEGSLVVGGVVDERELVIDGVGPYVRPAAIEERPDDAVGPVSLDAPEAPKSRAAKHPGEDRLRLILLGVAYRDAARPSLASHLEEGRVSELAGARLQRDAVFLELDAHRVERHTQPRRQLSDGSHFSG